MLDLKPTMDDEQYPTEETERLVREFEGDAKELLAALQEVWAHGSYGWHEEDGLDFICRPVRRYNVSTRGWSGNESLMDALQDNLMFWMRFWVQHRVGGHYVFEIGEGQCEVANINREPCEKCGRY